MLQKLSIQNYAIINALEVQFNAQLNIVTGETGAGKSIVMGALGLVLGNRADTSVLLNSQKKCVVEAVFTMPKHQAVATFLTDNELDQETTILLRREISTNGKTRAFINDTPVTLAQLKTLASFLVDLHQQLDTLEIQNHEFQFTVVDAIAENDISSYQTAYTAFKTATKNLQQLQQQQAQATATLDYNTFLYDELSEANFTNNEIETIEEELKFLSNGDVVKQQLAAAAYAFTDGEQPITQQLKVIYQKINATAANNKPLQEVAQRILQTQIELSDIANEIDHLNQAINVDAEKLQALDARLTLGLKLLAKHNVKTTAELLQIQQQLQGQLQQVTNVNQAIQAATLQQQQALTNCNTLATKIATNRKQAIPKLEKQINTLLAQVGMPNAQVKIAQTTTDLNAFGTDTIEFLFDANKTQKFAPVFKVASGGELSRLMLCIKSVVAQKIHLPTLIFDEIDTGISGEAAKQVGIIMQSLAKNIQVISITHQPQIAAKAQAHYFVYKQTQQNTVTTHIKTLTMPERVQAIAKMLVGDAPSEAALKNAEEMILR
jgi:DNA repair protein RecN (Recombination protein N)